MSDKISIKLDTDEHEYKYDQLVGCSKQIANNNSTDGKCDRKAMLAASVGQRRA